MYQILILIFLFITLFITPDAFSQDLRVKIGSFKNIYLSSPLPYGIVQKESQEVLYQGDLTKEVTVLGRGIDISGIGIYRDPLVIESSSKSFIKINNKRYRGSLELSVSGDNIKVINIIDLEQFLSGVIGGEMPPKWPEEALKAQVIASRTFALKNRGKHKEEGYDFCNGWHCQVYKGVDAETLEIRKIIDETKGLVLVYNNILANTPFHSCCGGVTAKSSLVWNSTSEYPYLEYAIDPFCKEAPHQRWREIVSEDTIRKKLSKRDSSLGEIYNITPINIGLDGRAKNISINHSNGELILNGNEFRLILDPTVIRSTHFIGIEKIKDRFVFSGYGWGHGVGLCQWGAKGMAESGKNYQEILRFYYPGTSLKDSSTSN
ncbi:SpoIID/LytB domain-containing protein [bacterium]|nr:SpoIID/LytB domain-containing protein [bacterium]